MAKAINQPKIKLMGTVNSMINPQTKESKMRDDNTKPEFFALWSVRQLQVECARLNQLLKEVIEISERALKNE